MRSFEARFSRPVMPGQKLLVEAYRLTPGSVALTVRVQDTAELAIANALFEYEV